MKLLPPHSQKVFSAKDLNNLKEIYTQLYPNAVMTNLSQFYLLSNKAVLATEVLGAVSTRNS